MAYIYKDRIKGNTVLFKPSKFKTIVIDAVNEADPQQKILSTIENHEIDNCIVKIIYSVKPEQVYSVNINQIKKRLSHTQFCSITPVVVQNPSGSNLPELDASLYNSPLRALDKYLELKPELNKSELMRKAQMLIDELN
ncbi:MAG: hypothetical protein AB7V50_00525 [Vampirovibrionia bacterium]